MSAGEQELPDDPFGDSGGGEGGETPADPSGSPMQRLLDGDAPGPSVTELRADYDMPQWMAVTARGVLRVATGSGIPPIFEIAVGSVMGIMGSDLLGDGDGGESGEAEGKDVDGEGVPEPPLA